MNDRLLEYSAHPSVSALLSLAKWSGPSVDEVREYTRRDALGDLIVETRAARGELPSGPDPIAVKLAHLHPLKELAIRQHVG
jgi:hypothetical protein